MLRFPSVIQNQTNAEQPKDRRKWTQERHLDELPSRRTPRWDFGSTVPGWKSGAPERWGGWVGLFRLRRSCPAGS